MQEDGASIRVFAVTMGADRWQTAKLTVREMKKEIYFCMVTGFGRSISEVGQSCWWAAISRADSHDDDDDLAAKEPGIFTEGVALGVLLLVMAFLLQWICDILQKEEAEDENY